MVSPTKKHREQGQHGSREEPQTKSGFEPVASSGPRPPGHLAPEDEALDARIRLKIERGEALDDEERAFLARMPADSSIPPEAFD